MFKLFAELIAQHLDGKRRAEAVGLLSRVMMANRQSSEPGVMMRNTAEAVGKFLEADRAGFFETAGDALEFSNGWESGKLPLLAGPVNVFGQTILNLLRTGESLGVSDIRTNPITSDSRFEQIGAVSLIAVPMVTNSELIAGFYVDYAAPRAWTAEEIRFAKDFGEQTWDAVERARVEMARRASEEHLHFALEAGGGFGTWDWDVASGLVFCNARLAELFSLDPASVRTGAPIADFFARIHPEDRAAVNEKISRAVSAGAEYAEEHRIVLKTGAVRWVYSRGRCHLDAQGRPLRFPGVLFDVTERHNHNRKMLQTAKLESLGVLAGGIAHDFNNLLTGILGNASLLQSMVSDEHRPFAEQIVSASGRAADLTRQMLAYSGKGRFEISLVNLSKQVREILPLIKPSLKSAAIRLELDEQLPLIKADASQMQQIIMNLAINAAEAMEGQSGEVTIRTGVSEVDAAYIEQATLTEPIAPGPYVWLEVQDSGVGMSKETQARIFDPFFTTKFMGRGLGLAAVSGIVRGHKGALGVHSIPGQGTTFKVLFPLSLDGKPYELPAAMKHDVTPEATILFVDDEEVVLSIGQNILHAHGYAVRPASSGQEAVDIFRMAAQEISLVVLDMTMPGMSGEDVFGCLREIKSDIPIVISSGYAEVEVIRRFTTGNIAGFIQKPYTAAQLLEKVNATLKSSN
jgi:PAS domain S-box-containing protein